MSDICYVRLTVVMLDLLLLCQTYFCRVTHLCQDFCFVKQTFVMLDLQEYMLSAAWAKKQDSWIHSA